MPAAEEQQGAQAKASKKKELPLSGLSVYVSADDQHDSTADDGSAATSFASTSNAATLAGVGVGIGASPSSCSTPVSATTSSPAAPFSPVSPGLRTSLSFNRTRRSRAHQPLLLGMDEESQMDRLFKDGSEETNEAVMLTGLGVHASPTTTKRRQSEQGGLGPPLRRRRSIDEREEQDQFRIADDSDGDDDDDDDDGDANGNDVGFVKTNGATPLNSRQSVSRARTGDPSSRVDDNFDNDDNLDEYDEHQLFHRTSSSGDGNADVEAYPYRDNDDGNDYGEEEEEEEFDEDDDGARLAHKLPFERITKREQVWMWLSVAFVAALSIVSIAIAVDWIDWPGDGIGKS